MQPVPEVGFSCFLASFSPLCSHISWLKVPSKNMLPKVKTSRNEDMMENLNAHILPTLHSQQIKHFWETKKHKNIRTCGKKCQSFLYNMDTVSEPLYDLELVKASSQFHMTWN